MTGRRFRVLRRDGWAVLLVPVAGDKTREDPSIVDAAERLRLFGQEDHVRRYGRDYLDRLREEGFRVEVTEVRDLVERSEAVRMGLTAESREIYYCTRGVGG